jgi:hypothetical protein
MTPTELSKVMALEAAIERRARRAHWYRVGTVVGLLCSGALMLWVVVEVAILLGESW